jgi:DNA-binding CsgD family transcriptional regulator
MRTYHAESARAGLEVLARAGLRPDEFSRELIAIVGRAVPFDAMCVATTDPATGFFTGSVKQDIDEDDELNYEFAVHEYATEDVNQFVDLARRRIGVGILRDDTGGDPSRSDRFSEMVHPVFNAEHELRAVARSSGSMWGAYALYRRSGGSGFSPAEADFLHGIESIVATGIRTSLVASAADATDDPTAPAVLMFDRDGRVTQATPSADNRLTDLGGESWTRLPAPVASVVSAARAGLSGGEWVLPRLRVRGRSGRWYVMHASPMQAMDGSGTQVVVTIEQAGPPDVVPLLIAAYGLSAREGDVLRGVLQGRSTKEIAAELHLSPYTVQDHLKVIFDKTGASSRRELTSQVFFSHQFERYGRTQRPSGSNLAIAG